MSAQWLVLDHFNQSQGPYSTAEIRALLHHGDYYVCRVGEKGWVLGRQRPELQKQDPGSVSYNLAQPWGVSRARVQTSADALLTLCRGLLADRYLSADEVLSLGRWLRGHADVLSEWPGNVIGRRVERVLAEGVITEAERAELQTLLERATGTRPEVPLGGTCATRLPVDEPQPVVTFVGKHFCLTGKFVLGPREHCKRQVLERDGVIEEKPTSLTDFLVIGTFATEQWAHQNYGRKIELGIRLRERGHGLSIISEEHWVKFLSDSPPEEPSQASPS